MEENGGGRRRGPAGRHGAREVGPRERPGVRVEVEHVAQVDGNPQQGQGGDRDLEQRPLGELPAVRSHRAEPLPPSAEQLRPALPLFRRQVRLHEVERPREWSEKGREGRAVVAVPAAKQHPQDRWRHAEARAAETVGPMAGGAGDGLLRLGNLALDLLLRVEVQPGLVVKGVVSDLVPRLPQAAQRHAVRRQGRVLADHEDGEALATALHEVEKSRHHQVEVAGERLPARIAVGLHVRPLVVEVEREAGDGRSHWRTPSKARSASRTLSFTFSVPLTMWAEPSR